MLAEDLPVGGLDRPGFGAKMPAQELLEGTFADETDPGAIRLVEYRQACRVRDPAHLRFVQVAQRE